MALKPKPGDLVFGGEGDDPLLLLRKDKRVITLDEEKYDQWTALRCSENRVDQVFFPSAGIETCEVLRKGRRVN